MPNRACPNLIISPVLGGELNQWYNRDFSYNDNGCMTLEADDTSRYYHSDELGSTLALTDETGSLAAEFAYMPYGHATANYLTPNTSNLTPFLWLGGYGLYYDSATDLHLTLHRAYSSKLKRFISADPLGIDGGVNVYMWANLNPLWFVDPYGLEAYNWDEMLWWEKLEAGYYYGTGYGQDALEYYISITLDPNAPWYQKGGAYVGGFFAALWTPDTYQETGWTLIAAYGVRNAGTPWQLRDGTSARTVIDYGNIIRVEKHMIGQGAARGMKRHVDGLNGLIRHWPH